VIEHHNGETAARAQFQIGETHFKQDQLEPAVKELLKVEIVYDYPKWSATALYEAGQVFEKMKDLDQAKAHYQLCADKYKEQPQGALARQRLNQLK
jgi:TolA-binding protein